MKIRHFSILLVLALVSLSCAFLTFGEAVTDPGDVLFQDDFSDPSSGWDRYNEENGITDYVDGAYRIFVNGAKTDIWANPGLSFTDVRVEVDARKTAGPDDNDFGLICRSQDVDQFYFFIISSDGYYAIGKVDGEAQQLLGMEAMQPSEVIKQGNETNRIRADCTGSTLALYVNNEKLGEAQDSSYPSGDVGLIAGSFDTPGTDVLFDNFSVLKPEAAE
jgi:hypothetical protein